MNPGQSWRTQKDFAKTLSRKLKNSACRSCATPAGILFPVTTGLTASVRKTSGQRFWSGPGILWRRINSARTNSLNGASWPAPSRCWVLISAPARRNTPLLTSSIATWNAEPSGANCGDNMAMSSRTMSGIGVWEMKWTGRGKWATRPPANMAARREIPRGRFG